MLSGNPNEGERDMAYYCLMIRDKYNKINGLLQSLDAAVGAVYIVSCNLSTVDGLINGAVCTIKHIDYRNSKNRIISSTLWVQFEDEQVGLLHRQEYKNYYGDGINNTGTPIFTQYRETTLCNCRAIRAQFPLIPAAAVTIHKCQGSTLRNVVVDIDVSPSPYYAENFEAAKNFYQHAHYVAASCVPAISGLQIIDWSPEYIGVNKKVEEHMEYMNKHNKLKLCYRPLRKMERSYKCSFLNTRSHTLKDSDVIILCETHLSPHDLNTDYKIDTFRDIVHRDETTGNESQSFHGLAAYVKDHLCLCEIHKQWNEGFESLYMCIHKKHDPQPIQFICMYASPKITFELLKKTLMKV